MKRLKKMLNSMQPQTTTYSEMYGGTMVVHDGIETILDYDPTYYHEKIGFFITQTHKLAQDKPTVTIMIPWDLLFKEEIVTPSPYAETIADFCLRQFKNLIDGLNEELYNGSRPDKENGKYYICDVEGEILIRNTAFFAMCPQKEYENGAGLSVNILKNTDTGLKQCLCLRLQVQLPKGKMKKTIRMLCHDLPAAVKKLIDEFDEHQCNESLKITSQQIAIRNFLKGSEYCAFIANGSILPREKGSYKPLQNAIPFQSNPEDEIEIAGIRGMGIQKGITVIAGNGYSGKSTLLDAIAAGIYNHALGDGRELCITDESAVTITAEEGRAVQNLNISPFIQWLPDEDVCSFSTTCASGSTSQASNIMEAVDAGTSLLLIDEDQSAINFMIRDQAMKQLIEKETIIPFSDRVKELYLRKGISTILVSGGSGAYLSVADHVYQLEQYQIYNVTQIAKAITSLYDDISSQPGLGCWIQKRILQAEGFTSYPKQSGKERLQVSEFGLIMIGDEQIDIRGLHNIVSPQQLDALGFMLRYLTVKCHENPVDLHKEIKNLYITIEKDGLDCVYSSYFTTCNRFLALPRKQELLALIHRMKNTTYKDFL